MPGEYNSLYGTVAGAVKRRPLLFLLASVLVSGSVVGLANPLSESKVGLEGTAVARVSSIIGWLYFFAWSVSFWPQVVENWARGSVDGLSQVS